MIDFSAQRRTTLALAVAAVVLGATGCSTTGNQSNLVAFTTQLRGANEVPPVATQATGSVDAVLDTTTNLLRWKVNHAGLSGPATAGHFHGPAAIGANAGVALPWKGPVSATTEGRATLTPTQAADLLAGRWYANIHTAAHPAGEIRGQMTPRY